MSLYEFIPLMPSGSRRSDLCFSAVKYQVDLLGKDLKEGDVIMTNSPQAGGTWVPSRFVISFIL